ncbi:MAG TPA: M48 family metalloprotease, partial [Ilumatobacteraceae bacterium]|nr:M48 family metalloprotease [Ilumatobacteraceae bacterium]
WLFLSGLILTTRISARTERAAEFEADRRAVAMGFGRELATALRRVEHDASLRDGGVTRLRGELHQSHPQPRARVQRIEAMLRRDRTGRDGTGRDGTRRNGTRRGGTRRGR